VNDPVVVLLKFGFLAVLYLFLLWVVRSALRDLRRRDDAVSPVSAAAPRVARGRRNGRGAGDGTRPPGTPRLVVVRAGDREPGTAFDVGDGATLGRARSADINVEDPFASSAHARIYSSGHAMYIEDMGSTNGTYLNGRQLRQPEPLSVEDEIRIGETEYRYKE
jgi:FHA domain